MQSVLVREELSVEIEIDSPKTKVWAAIIDIDNCVNVISGIIDLKILERPEQGLVGPKWTETRKMFGKESSETMWLTECQDESYYCTRAENHGAIYTTRMAVVERGARTLLTLSFAGTSDSLFIRCISAVMTVFMNKSMTKMLQKDLSDIKAFVEQGK